MAQLKAQKGTAKTLAAEESKATAENENPFQEQTHRNPVNRVEHSQKVSEVYTKLRREGRGRTHRDMREVRKRVQEFLEAKEREESS